MTSKRVYIITVSLIGLLTLAIIGGAYGTQHILQAKSADLVALKAKLIGYTQQQASLVRARKDIADYNELYTISKAVVPENKNQAETVRQIVNLATANSVSLGSITFPSSTLGNTLGNVPAVSSAPTLTPSTKTLSIGTADLSQLTPVVGSPGVYVLQISVASDPLKPASYPQLINFLSALEKNRLTAEVTTISIVPDPEIKDRFSFSLSLNSYIKP